MAMSETDLLLGLCKKACFDGECLIALKLLTLLISPTGACGEQHATRLAATGHGGCRSLLSTSAVCSVTNCVIDVLCRIQGDESFQVIHANDQHNQLQIIRRSYKHNSDVLLQLSNIYFSSELHLDALQTAQEAIALDAKNASALETFENLCCHVIDRWHFIMLNDFSRNTAYEGALHEVMTLCPQEMSVLDVGCGTGVLSFLAAKWSKKVYAVERSPLMCQIAENTFKSSEVEKEILDKISVINKMSTELNPTDLPTRVDVLVTEIFDAGLFGEGILSTLTHAWKQLLKKDVDEKNSIVIPFGATLYVEGVESVDIRNESTLNSWNYTLTTGDISVVSNVGMLESDPYTSVRVDSLPFGYKSVISSTKMMSVDFNNPKGIFEMNKGLTDSLDLDVTEDGMLDALCVWFRLHLTDSIEISTEVGKAGCWEQAIFPVSNARLKKMPVSKDYSSPQSLKVCAGDKVSVAYSVKEDRLSMGITSVRNQSNELMAVEKSPGFPPAHELLSHPLEWCPKDVYCLSDWEIRALNDTPYQDDILGAMEMYLKSDVNGRMTKSHFLHVNDGFSPLSLLALSRGFDTVQVLTPQDSQKALLWKLVQLNKLDVHRIKPIDDVSELVDDDLTDDDDDDDDGSDSEPSQAVTEKSDKTFIVFDVIDHTGRLVENWMDKLDSIRIHASSFTSVHILPEVVDIWGVLIESDSLLSRNRVVTNDNLLGFPVKDYINRYSTMNHPAICLSTLKHTKLTPPFKLSSLNFMEELSKSQQPNRNSLDKGEKNPIHSRLQDKIIDIQVAAVAEGRIDALVYWFDLHISPCKRVSTLDSTHHWHQASVVFDHDRRIGEGEELQLKTSVQNSTIFVSFVE